MNILYEDNHLIAFDKPAEQLTQPSGTDQISLEKLAKEWIAKRDKKPGAVYLHAIHRLDKAVSGIVLFAKTEKALKRLQSTMREGLFTKIYTAEVSPVPQKDHGDLTHYLVHGDRIAMIVTSKDPKAKKCRLSYKVISKQEKKATLEIELHTGRYHQIRAQLMAIGSPVIGDKKYGSQVPFSKGIALKHTALTFPHPIKKTPLTITCASIS